MKFSAETAEYVQKVLAARSAMEATADTSRKMGEDVAKAGDKMVEKFKEVESAADSMKEQAVQAAEAFGSAFGAIAGTAAGVEKGVELMIEGVNRQLEETERRAEQLLRGAAR